MTKLFHQFSHSVVDKPDPQRRRILRSTGTAASCVLLGSTFTGLSRQAFGAEVQAPHTIPLGDMSLTVLSDGTLTLPVDFILPDALIDSTTRDTLLEEGNLSTKQFTNDCNVTLLETSDRKIIFDVGAGFNFMPNTGKLVEQLENHGIAPDEITDVVFTHAHPDHLWGLLDDFDDLFFPDANYHMHESEYDYWMDEKTLAATPEARQTFVVGAQNRLPLIADQLTTFRYGEEIIPGIESVDSHGHTPGHTSFVLHGGSNPVHLIGDALTNHFLSFKHPEQALGADQDKDAAVASRLRLLDRFVAEKEQILGFHLPFPGLGQVEKSDATNEYSFAIG